MESLPSAYVCSGTNAQVVDVHGCADCQNETGGEARPVPSYFREIDRTVAVGTILDFCVSLTSQRGSDVQSLVLDGTLPPSDCIHWCLSRPGYA